MMHTNSNRLSASVGGLSLLATALVVAGCTGGSAGDRDNRGDFKVTTISTGAGAIYPYRIREADNFGNPTTNVLNIDTIDILKNNANGNNGVLPVATFSTAAELPDGNPGNHFIFFEFSHKLDVESILSPLLAGQSNSGLTGALNVLAYDPATESTVTLTGRGFVNGYTYFLNAGVLSKVKAVQENGSGITVLDSRANGFPNYAGAASLVGKKAFVFVADNDNNLASFDTFPNNRLIRLVVTNAVRDTENDLLEQEVVTATTVGSDPNPPEVLGYTTSTSYEITPGNNQTGVSPTTTVLVRFNKPVQPTEVGAFYDPQVFTPPSGGLILSVTAAAQTFGIIYFADPIDYSDMVNYVVTPAYNLPGDADVDVTVQNTSIHSINSAQLLGTAITTRFSTGTGPGLINAPVAPQAIYIGIGGADPGVSAVDMNGFGQGTGDLSNTRWPLNPNIGAPGVNPPLSIGNSNLNAGSAGVLTLVKDTNLSTKLIGEPLVGEILDIHVGAPLDLVFNNENINVNATRSNQTNALGSMPGNNISHTPHPNPPPLLFPPPNPNRAIFGQEPTVTSSGGAAPNIITTSPPCANMPINLLAQGNPWANTVGEVGTFQTQFMGTFVGPQLPPVSPPPPTPYCPFVIRQQIGHFLYLLDRSNRQIVVLNSNRFTILDTIRLSDPVSMAMSPAMNLLAVTNFASSTVSFIDINPFSNSFHTVVNETRVERGPTGIAWQPDGEDVLVVSGSSNALSIIAAQGDFPVRRVVTGFLNNPIDVAVTTRFLTSGFAQGVYFAYVLNGNGTVAVYESGPDGVNGIGFNDVIGTVPNATFTRARSIVNDYRSNFGAVMIGHVDDTGLGQISRLELYNSPPGQQPLNANSGGFILPPTYRQKEWQVTHRYGGTNRTNPLGDYLSGNAVVDIAFDDMFNYGVLAGQASGVNSGYMTTPWTHSGKHGVKPLGGGLVPGTVPIFMFAALSDRGKVDVIELSSGNIVTTLSVPDVRCVSCYFRQ